MPQTAAHSQPASAPRPAAPAPSARPAARSRRKDARPGELLAAATELFIEKGFASTRVEEVAARAGVSKGTLFLYYPSKAELLQSVVREHLGSRFAQWSVEIDEHQGDTASLLRYALHQWWTCQGSTAVAGLRKLILAEANNFPELADFYAQEVQCPGTELLRRIIRRGIDRKEFVEVDVEYAVCCLKAQMQFLELQHHAGAAADPGTAVFEPERFIDVLLELMLHGLSRPARATARRPAPCAVKSEGLSQAAV